TTGWISATVDGQSAVDARIETDPERFWDIYQGKTLPKIYDNVMKITGNRPTADKQPFHRDLDIEVWMSEPDFRIGVDEEQASAPITTRALVTADRVAEIELQSDPKDEREGLRAADALENLARLHAAGLYKTELSYDHVDRIAFSLAMKDARPRRLLPNTGAS